MDNFKQTICLSELRDDCYFLNHLGSKVNYQIQYDLSIIVPCYNSEKYISRCITSILEQVTNYSYEVICVDDGSTDRTGQYLDMLQNDSRVLVLHQENMGHSGARNTALSYASGQYLMFVDSDDVLLPNAIDSLVRVAKNGYDIVQGKYFDFSDDVEVNELIQKQRYSDLKIDTVSPVASWPGYAWMKVFHRRLFANIVFPLNLWFEDTIIVFLVYPQAKKCAQINQFVYGYRNNPTSITHVSSKYQKSMDTFLITKMMLNMINKYHICITNDLYNRFLDQVFINSARLWRFPYLAQKKVFFQTRDYLYNVFQRQSVKVKPTGLKKNFLSIVMRHNLFLPLYTYVMFEKVILKTKMILKSM